MRRLLAIPHAPLLLGFAGLLPFWVTSLASVLAAAPVQAICQRALMGYGAVILSFLGGIRWGVAMAAVSPAPLVWRLGFSVVPSLAGWVALLLSPVDGLLLLALGFMLMALADLGFTAAPAWYRDLRAPLSVGAVGALLLGLLT
jgi:hypothetical protein